MQSINWHSVIFLLFSLLACGFALAVVFTSNVVRMAFYLVLSLGATAGLFFLAGADFVGAMQILIYVGGTLVLLVFGVMLTAQGPFISMKTASGEWILTALVGGSLLAVLLPTAYKIADWNRGQGPKASGQGTTADVASGIDSLPQAQPTATRIGLGLLGGPSRSARRCAGKRSRRFVWLFTAVRNCVRSLTGRLDRGCIFGPR